MGEGRVAGVDARSLSRVVVVGCSGSGKSTMARALSSSLDAPCVELDGLFWGPGWEPRPEQDFLDDVDAATRGERWVVDGNYSRTRDIFWPRATAIVWLNYGFATVFGRSLRRTIGRCLTREVLWQGNRESLWRTIASRESILWWVITSYPRSRRNYRALKDGGRYARLAWHELDRPAEAARFLQTITRRSG